jgi:hypothetical protein
MPIQCIFCDNNSGNKEHLWPKWIHERKDFGPLNFQLGGSEKKVIPNPEITVKTVCGVCNNGWMSKLESENIPTFGSMLQDIAIPLDEVQQKSVAAWSVKTAMVSDSMKGRAAANQFYSRLTRIFTRAVQDLAKKLGKTDVEISAASKFLWLRHKAPLVIYDDRVSRD